MALNFLRKKIQLRCDDPECSSLLYPGRTLNFVESSGNIYDGERCMKNVEGGIPEDVRGIQYSEAINLYNKGKLTQASSK